VTNKTICPSLNPMTQCRPSLDNFKVDGYDKSTFSVIKLISNVTL